MKDLQNPLPLENGNASRHSTKRLRAGLITTLAGYAALIMGARPSVFGMDRSPVIGFVQTAFFIIGIGIICIGGYITLMSFWPKNHVSLTADFGLRLVGTGFVIAVFTGMADVFGFGSHQLPSVPFFGPLQASGVVLAKGSLPSG